MEDIMERIRGGRPATSQHRRPVTMTFPFDEVEQLDEVASRYGVTRTELIRQMYLMGLDALKRAEEQGL